MTSSEINTVAAAHDVVVAAHTGARILCGATVTLRAGEVTCLVGPSGAGKTTLALLFAGLLADGLALQSGRIEIGGVGIVPNGESLRAIRGRRVGCVFQDPDASLNPFRRCGAQVEDALRIHGSVVASTARLQVLRQFERMGLEDAERIYRSFPREISGGQRQRVLIAMASLLSPELLIADEPTAALDAVSASAVLNLLRQFAREEGKAVLVVSHDLDVVAAAADRVYRIDEGVASEVQPPFTRPAITSSQAPDSGAEAGTVLEVNDLAAGYQGLPRGAAARAATGVLFQNLSFRIGAREIVGIVGPSGVGKSTLGRCVAGLVRPLAGSAVIDGRPVESRGSRPHDGRVQMIYQSPASSLDSRQTVAQILNEALEAGRVPESEWTAEVARLLRRVGLPLETAEKRATMLSGGESQRVAIARAVSRRPRVIVADEPTAALDDANKQIILDLLTEHVRREQIALLLITHERALAERYVSRMIELASP